MDTSGERMRESSAYAPTESDVSSGVNRTIDITLVGEAADSLVQMASETGMPIESLLEVSISLLRVAVRAREVGRRFVVTTKMWWPIKEFVLPRAS